MHLGAGGKVPITQHQEYICDQLIGQESEYISVHLSLDLGDAKGKEIIHPLGYSGWSGCGETQVVDYVSDQSGSRRTVKSHSIGTDTRNKQANFSLASDKGSSCPPQVPSLRERLSK